MPRKPVLIKRYRDCDNGSDRRRVVVIVSAGKPAAEDVADARVSVRDIIIESAVRFAVKGKCSRLLVMIVRRLLWCIYTAPQTQRAAGHIGRLPSIRATRRALTAALADSAAVFAFPGGNKDSRLRHCLAGCGDQG